MKRTARHSSSDHRGMGIF